MAFTISINDQAAFEVLFAGPAGPTGPQGPQGIQGVPGQGVPVGGTTGQVLAKVDGVDYNTEWITPQDEYAVWGGITGTLSAQLDLQAALDGKYSTTNPDGFITASALTPYLTKAGNLTGLTDLALARDNLQLGTLYSPTFAGLTIQGAGANVAQLTSTALSLNHTGYGQFTIQPSSGITFPDATVQTTAYTGTASVSWGDILGTLSSQTDLQSALDDKYDASNPAGFIDSSALTGYATESWVQSQGYIASLQNLTTDISWDISSQAGRLLIDGYGGPDASARLNFGVTSPTVHAYGDFWYDGQNFLYESGSYGTETIASQAWVNAGVTFSGKTNFTSVDGAAGLNIGIGGSSANATVNGDIWIPTAGTNLNFRDGNGIARVCASTTSGNTFNQPQNIDTSNILPALRVTQRGTGNALLVEDQTTPDTSALVVDAAGNVGVGVATGYTSTSKFEVVGNVKGTTLSTASGPVFSFNSVTSHTGGSDTNDLIVTIGGVNYRIGLRPA